MCFWIYYVHLFFRCWISYTRKSCFTIQLVHLTLPTNCCRILGKGLTYAVTYFNFSGTYGVLAAKTILDWWRLSPPWLGNEDWIGLSWNNILFLMGTWETLNLRNGQCVGTACLVQPWHMYIYFFSYVSPCNAIWASYMYIWRKFCPHFVLSVLCQLIVLMRGC